MGWVTIKTLGDDQIEAFMRCPYRFYHGWIKGKSSQPEWRMRVQYVVNRIVKNFYTLPQNKRSSLQVLEQIEKYWKSFIRSDIFPTRSQGI
ncbi:hypothetical protein CathTA2_1341 [Caldalkalibacillus thermarum TA2.A1]|uniref:PD-(D/E)XK endonuclease-like domain-containing protein n=1 Tax=Caldalkalibacillus thermarum (strain TA2.A1) TaxID=986075 RepID=F5L6C8_CALTT|nr:hypothetical protein [Caldalkalibacillus thermarum]EGL83128.1 hypothetical protein CathTA2_1341 [Caldalkalibacillus thermarum TA2.A1]QZT32459.1 hypothetical protein HUR95_08475 [Caldalkalibacillus thermarum TA2.A1]